MKKILSILIFILVTNVAYAASEKIYLKCNEFVTENQVTAESGEDNYALNKGMYSKGTFLTISFAELVIKESGTKIMVYRSPFDGEGRVENYNKIIPSLTMEGKHGKKIKAIVKNNTYTYENSGTFDPFEWNDIYKYIKIDNIWTVEIKKLFKVTNNNVIEAHMEWLAEGKCVLLDKKTFKIKIKKGINEEDETL